MKGKLIIVTSTLSIIAISTIASTKKSLAYPLYIQDTPKLDSAKHHHNHIRSYKKIADSSKKSSRKDTVENQTNH
jgi:hypothetical protein